jgi:hypothetical protein
MRYVVTTNVNVAGLLSMVVMRLVIIVSIADSNAVGNLADISAKK